MNNLRVFICAWKVVVVGGMESMSNCPYYVPKARFGSKFGHQQLVDGCVQDGLWDVHTRILMFSRCFLCTARFHRHLTYPGSWLPLDDSNFYSQVYNNYVMGNAAEECARKYEFTREQQVHSWVYEVIQGRFRHWKLRAFAEGDRERSLRRRDSEGEGGWSQG